MTRVLGLLSIVLLLAVGAAPQTSRTVTFLPVPELGYRLVPDFFTYPSPVQYGETSGVALNSKGHIFLFQRAHPMLAEFDERGKFLRSIGDGLFDHPHGLRIDAEDNIWTTDDGNHVVLELSPSGRVLLVLGRKDWGAEADWLLNKPADVAFGKAGEIYVADGYGNSRVVKFDPPVEIVDRLRKRTPNIMTAAETI